ncbi:MAG: maltose alpha-D-glucosyltransferase [Planctomycetia bacterium]|nr:maltose alpha-D-glucosyltransferase [Planctomycetia bacterium]
MSTIHSPEPAPNEAAMQSGTGAQNQPLVNATSQSDFEASRPADWYKDVVIYQMHVRSFFDSSGDGIGDFAGLTEKLEYVASLGVSAIWLLPFYPSPLRDEGYDIADYSTVNPMYGNLDDFKKFLDKAHRLGLNVITEMVINHTSDQHAWFQRARRAPKGSPEREFYVWSDTTEKYREARIIFQDFEVSNWTWDHEAQQYFWHRFYSHQPDLNFDNEVVQETLLKIVDFWFAMGIDGLRLDAIPYLYEREGTNCENLPETHAFLRRLRKHIDDHYPGRMLLAEANQWPDETSAYFGDDDECQMCFNFPLMPRLFMAVQQEERFPIVDILQHTPAPPPTSQWAIFLRNHDELTLEMVTDEERDAMYRFYMTDPRARVNLGLRRRLAPLLRNDRRKIELMHSLLFALPGTPVMYYGDEICMGDNIYLRDRDAVRTPMQWSSDRNGGFSRANPQRLFLPPISDPEYHYQSVNVETEEQSPHSFLWWVRRVLRLRQRFKSFSRGEIEFLLPQNPRVLAFLRKYEDETLLVVVNLSRFPQAVELDLGAYRGRSPVELFGQSRFPMIGELPYMLTVGPHGFYWFQIERPHGEAARRSPSELPIVRVASEWTDALRVPALDRIRDGLSAYLRLQSWHLASERTIRTTDVVEVVPIGMRDDDGSTYAIVLLRVFYTEGEPGLYQLILIATPEARAQAILRDRPTAGAVRVRTRNPAATWFVCDATAEANFWERLAKALAAGASVPGLQGRIDWRPLGEMPRLDSVTPAAIVPLWRSTYSRGAVAALDKFLFLKLFRRIEPGIHPEVEIGTALAAMPGALSCSKLRGTFRFQDAALGEVVLGVAYDYVTYERPLADLCREELRREFERVSADRHLPAPQRDAPTTPAETHSPAQPSEHSFGPLPHWFRLLGASLAEIHLALAGLTDRPEFAPEPFNTHYRRSISHGFRAQTARAFAALRTYLRLHPDTVPATQDLQFLSEEYRIAQRFGPLSRSSTPLWRVRCHGSLTTNEVLLQGDHLQIVDWGGNPGRPLSERRIKRSVFIDLARIDRAIQIAAQEGMAAWFAQVGRHAELAAKVQSWAEAWRRACAEALLSSYRAAVVGQLLVPEDEQEFQQTLDAFRLTTVVEDLTTAMEKNQPAQVAEAVAACRTLLT